MPCVHKGFAPTPISATQRVPLREASKSPASLETGASILEHKVCLVEYQMLPDRKFAVERLASEFRWRKILPEAYGAWLDGLAPWSWFVTVTFRDRNGYAPTSDGGIRAIEGWLRDLGKMAGAPIGFVIGEEFGPLGNRFHCHLLVCGVSHLSRRFWWYEAYRRFGRARILPFDPKRGATFYVSKYVAKTLGEIHLGGTLAGCDLSKVGRFDDEDFFLTNCEQRVRAGCEIAHSAALPKEFYRLGLGRWHR